MSNLTRYEQKSISIRTARRELEERRAIYDAAKLELAINYVRAGQMMTEASKALQRIGDNGDEIVQNGHRVLKNQLNEGLHRLALEGDDEIANIVERSRRR